MSKQNLVSNAVRFALVCGAASGFVSQAALADPTAAPAGGTGAAPAAAPAATPSSGSTSLGKIEVTGSRIKRTELEQAQPVTVISAEAIKESGLTTIGEVMQRLTSTGASLNTLDNFGGNFTFTGGGQSTVDLRNLGSSRVLVLVNGKRWVTALDGTVDLNTIPTSIIDHIEVLQDGASAIYGSDAISGVVNIITIKNYNIREASAYLGAYQGDGHTDGKTQSYDFTMGSSNEKSGLVFNLSYTNQDAIYSADRNISKEPIIGLGNAGGSSALPNGRFVFLPPGTKGFSGTANNAPAPSTGLSLTQCPDINVGTKTAPNFQPFCDLTLIQGTNGSKGSDYRPFVSGGPTSDRFNYAPYNLVLTPEERYSGYVQGYTDLSDHVTFKADMLYSHRNSYQQAAPEPLFFASSSIALDIPANQKYNPFHTDLNASSLGANLALLGLRMTSNGLRTYQEDENTYRMSGGFEGYFGTSGGGEWDWDANYAFSSDNEIDTNNGHFNVANLRLALGDPATCAAVIGCVPFDAFGGQSAITKPMLNYIAYTAQNQFTNDQRVYNLDLSNSDLAELSGGPLGFATGFQYLEHNGDFLPDSVAQQGYDSFNPGRDVLPTEGRTAEKSEYAELDMPFLGGMPGVKLLDLDIAGRHTNYNTYGGNNTYRWGLKWEPNSSFLARATWSQGFRAPSIQDLYSSGTNFSANITDPCSGNGGVGLCKNVPSNYVQPNPQINTFEIGNSNLKPETSISRTVGFVYSPDWLTGFNFNADYYRIEVDNTIQPISGQLILNGCYTVPVNASDCSRITRTVFGAIQTLNDQVTNIGATITSGIDVGFSYVFPSTSVGDFKASLDDTHIKSFTQTYPNANGPATTIQLAGVERGGSVFPFGVPHDKIHGGLDWTAGNWSANYTLRYIGPLTEVPTDNHIGATTYHDVQLNYSADALATTFSFGIRNLFSKEPPSSTVQELNNFDPTLYDVPGRFMYLRATARF